jgi:hypothetical protein
MISREGDTPCYFCYRKPRFNRNPAAPSQDADEFFAARMEAQNQALLRRPTYEIGICCYDIDQELAPLYFAIDYAYLTEFHRSLMVITDWNAAGSAAPAAAVFANVQACAPAVAAASCATGVFLMSECAPENGSFLVLLITFSASIR